MKKTEELKEINKKDTAGLVKDLAELRSIMVGLKVKASFNKLKNFHEITVVRKKIARISTIMNNQIIEKLEKKAKV